VFNPLAAPLPPPPPVEHTQSDTVPTPPEGITIAWRCEGIIIAIIEKELEG
jgi:hypothetical protein